MARRLLNRVGVTTDFTRSALNTSTGSSNTLAVVSVTKDEMNRDEIADKACKWIMWTIATKEYRQEKNRTLKAGRIVRERRESFHFKLGDSIKFSCLNCKNEDLRIYEGSPGSLPKYCSEICKNTAWKKSVRNRQPPFKKCPHPQKTSFFSGEVAEKYLTSLRQVNNSFFMAHVYTCQCGKYHLGRVEYKKI